MGRQGKAESSAKLVGLVQDLLIIELAKAGVSQPRIREIVGVDMARVSRIARHVKRSRK